MDERLADINNSMGTLTGRVDNMDKRFEELESIGDFEELHGEVQDTVNCMVADVNKGIQAPSS